MTTATHNLPHPPDVMLDALIIHQWDANEDIRHPAEAPQECWGRYVGEYLQAKWMTARREGEALGDFMAREQAALTELRDIGWELYNDGYALKWLSEKPGQRSWVAPPEALAWRVVKQTYPYAFGMFTMEQLIYVVKD